MRFFVSAIFFITALAHAAPPNNVVDLSTRRGGNRNDIGRAATGDAGGSVSTLRAAQVIDPDDYYKPIVSAFRLRQLYSLVDFSQLSAWDRTQLEPLRKYLIENPEPADPATYGTWFKNLTQQASVPGILRTLRAIETSGRETLTVTNELTLDRNPKQFTFGVGEFALGFAYVERLHRIIFGDQLDRTNSVNHVYYTPRGRIPLTQSTLDALEATSRGPFAAPLADFRIQIYTRVIFAPDSAFAQPTDVANTITPAMVRQKAIERIRKDTWSRSTSKFIYALAPKEGLSDCMVPLVFDFAKFFETAQPVRPQVD